MEKASKITKPTLSSPQSAAQSEHLTSQAAPRAEEPSGALWRGGISLAVLWAAPALEHFHSFRQMPQPERARPLAPAQLLLWKGPIPGQEKEVGTKSMYIKGSEWKKHKPCQNA